jgi:hypothetical protein
MKSNDGGDGRLEEIQADSEYKLDPNRSWSRAFATIYRLRVIIVIVGLVLFSIACFKIDELIPSTPALQYFDFFPFKAFGEASLIAAVVGITFEIIVRRDAESKLIELVNIQLRENAQNIATLVSRNLLTDKKVMAEVLKPEEVDSIIRNALELQYGETQLVTDIQSKILRRVLTSHETWSNYKYKGALSKIDDPHVSWDLRNSCYDIYIDLSYQTCLQKTEFLFTTARTTEEFNAHLRDPEIQECWLIPPSRALPTLDASVFRILNINVGGQTLHVRKTKDTADKVSYVCSHQSLKEMIGKEVVIHYRYRSRINKLGHLFTVSPIYPTNGLIIELDFANTDIHYVNVLDFFSPVYPSLIRYTPPDKPHKIEVELNDWSFPKSGVTFVWVLEEELTRATS